MAGKSVMVVGDRFHRLVVIGLVKHHKNPNAICLCDCGNTITTQRGGLRNGHTKSCGCHRKEMLSAHVESIRLTDEEKRAKYRLYAKKWADNNYARYREIQNASNRRYYRKNPDLARANCQKRRARLMDKMGSVSKGIQADLFSKQKGRCACCGSLLKKAGQHLDHKIPLAGGGIHEDANLQLLCKKCNLSKGAKDPIEFMQSRGFLL